MTTSAEMPDEIWASNLGGWWSHVTNAATTRYIRADIADELRKSRDHHASTIFIQEARIVSQAAEIAALKAENNTLRADAINAARLADQLIDMHRSGWIITNSILGASVLNEVLGHLRGDKS